MEAGYNDDIVGCLKICDNIDDNNINKFFSKLDNCLELGENLGREQLIFYKALLGILRKCRINFLKETTLPYKDVADISNYFSEYIKEMAQLEGVDSTAVETSMEKKSGCVYPSAGTKLHRFSTIFIILALLTLLLGLCTCWLFAVMKRQNERCCKLTLPKEMVENLALTCQEMGLDPREMRILKEKTCFDREYENIVNKYLKKRSESPPYPETAAK
ncbi:hypothetical protein O3M35_005850 [Rhynocoris fuscipes]|uniref:Uncharacterized protein n=1 Tax=Rhynocoris fuscipes TaxID=488301 RepID=A0AAW1DQ41_9HEMI